MNPWRLATHKMERSLLNLAEYSYSKLQGVTSWVHLSRIKPVSTDMLQEPEDPPSNHPCEFAPPSKSPWDLEDTGQPENSRWMSEPRHELKLFLRKNKKTCQTLG